MNASNGEILGEEARVHANKLDFSYSFTLNPAGI